jgi:hypothetical protein
MINRRSFLYSTSAFSAASLLTPALWSQSSSTKKPNIVMFYVDDLGWRDVGYMGSDFYETPNIDRLASEGMVFTNAYACAPNCAPGMAFIPLAHPNGENLRTVNSSLLQTELYYRLISLPLRKC